MNTNIHRQVPQIKKGEIYWADLSPIVGSEQGGLRPVLIIQNDIGNKHAPTTIIAILTTRTTKAKMPTHYWLNTDCGLPTKSMVECEQIRTIDKRRLREYIGKVSDYDLEGINERLKISLEIR